MFRLLTKARPEVVLGSAFIPCRLRPAMGLPQYPRVRRCSPQWYNRPMCPGGQASKRTGSAPDQSDGCTEKEDRWEGMSPSWKKISPDLVLRDCHATTAPGAIGDLRNHRHSTQLQQQFPQSVALIEFHVHEFESHCLGPRSADNCLRLDVAHAVRKLQRQ